MKTFKHWKRQELVDVFGLKQKRQCDDLDDWLNSNEDVPKDVERELIRFQQILHENVDHWNKQELIYQFVAPFIHKIDYKNNLYRLFLKRKLSGEVNGQLVSGEVDMMLASGKPEPEAPYFCLYEYKKEKRGDIDSLGQLIIAMMTAQAANRNVDVIYGVFVVGRNWFFLTLKGREYCISNEYVATRDDDIFTIFKILIHVSLKKYFK